MNFRGSMLLSMCLVLAAAGLCQGSTDIPLPRSAIVLPAGAAQPSGEDMPSMLLTAMLPRARVMPVNVEKPLPPEKNPPGDIPDSQVFITYASAVGGYQLKVPEGWGRSARGADVKFTRYFDGLSVSVTKASRQPTPESIRSAQARGLKQAGRAAKINSIKAIEVSHRSAVLMTYQSNSVPSPVTGRRVRLENATYFFYRAGKLAALHLWAPLGADNVDQWRLISHSFRWR